MAPEMVAFSTRFGFDLMAHELGDANRSARVEGPFDYIDKNFYAGRTFKDVADLNEQLLAWCAKTNAKLKKRLGTTPLALFATELSARKQLPTYVPEVYALHRRSVDLEGYVTLHNNRCSLPAALIDREVAVHETKNRVRVFDGHRLVCEHARADDGAAKRSTLPEHEQEGRWHRRGTPRPPSPEEKRLRADSPGRSPATAVAMASGLRTRSVRGPDSATATPRTATAPAGDDAGIARAPPARCPDRTRPITRSRRVGISNRESRPKAT